MVDTRVGFESLPLPDNNVGEGSIADYELPLTSLSIGGSTRRASKKRSLTLLLLNSTEKFVFLDHKFWHPSKDGHRKRLQRMWRQMPFAGSSPFHHSRGRDSGFVLAFEVEWSSICGMDYSNPLCQDGRVVVEAKQVIKREFQTVQDAKTFYQPVNLLPPTNMEIQPWAVSSRPSLADLSSLAPTTAPCSPDVSIRGGAQGTSPALTAPPNRSWNTGHGCQAAPVGVGICTGGQQSASAAQQAGPIRSVSPHQCLNEGGITHALNVAAASPLANRNSYSSGTARQADQRAWAGHLFPADTGSSVEHRPGGSATEGKAHGSLSSSTCAVSPAREPKGWRLHAPSLDPAGNRASAAMLSPARRSAAETSSIALSPQRMPARQFEEFHSCTSSSDGKRSVSEPRQRIKRPPLSGSLRSGEVCEGILRDVGRHASGQPVQRGRRTADTLHIASPTYQVTRQQDSWHSAEPSLKHVRSASLDGISQNSAQAMARFGAASTSSYGDIVSPGSLYGSSPGDESQHDGPWPSPSCWTMESHTYAYRSVAFQFTDARMPTILRPAIQGDERLLKLYESGLPAWAIYMPLYRLPYRPWMRTVSYCLFVAISVFSMAMGFYDLIKNVPYLHKVLSSLLVPSSFSAWLDSHVQVRLSILFAYLFGKSQLFMQLLRWLGHAWAVLRTGMEPIVSLLGPPLQSAWEALQIFGSSLHMVATAWGAVLGNMLTVLLGPPASALLGFFRAILELVMPIFQLLKLVVVGPISMVGAALQWAWGSVRVVWAALVALYSVMRDGWRATSVVRQGTRQVGEQASWWYLVQADAVELVRVSSLKTFRALQTFIRFFTQVCADIARHRLTLTLRISRHWLAFKARCHSAIEVPLLWCTMLLHYLFGPAINNSAAGPIDADAPLSEALLGGEADVQVMSAQSVMYDSSEGRSEYFALSEPEYGPAWGHAAHVKSE
ncbi:g329 [Coccomyxa elongata]